MANDPAFLLYSKDWIQGTAEMSAEEKGVYIDLLAHQHQDNGLPNDTSRLARIVHLSQPEFLKVWKYLSKKFHEEDGKLFNEKLQRVVNGRSEYSEMRRIIGTLGRILKDLDITAEQKKVVKKMFSWQSYISAKSQQNLSKAISSWVSDILANCSPPTTPNDGNENGNEDYINNSTDKLVNTKPSRLNFDFPNYPTEINSDLELPITYIKKSIEYLDINKQIKKSEGQIFVMWEFFKLQNFTGKKFYPDLAEIFTHFLRTLNNEKNGAEYRTGNPKPELSYDKP